MIGSAVFAIRSTAHNMLTVSRTISPTVRTIGSTVHAINRLYGSHSRLYGSLNRSYRTQNRPYRSISLLVSLSKGTRHEIFRFCQEYQDVKLDGPILSTASTCESSLSDFVNSVNMQKYKAVFSCTRMYASCLDWSLAR